MNIYVDVFQSDGEKDPIPRCSEDRHADNKSMAGYAFDF